MQAAARVQPLFGASRAQRDGLDLADLGDLVTAPSNAVAEHARAALAPVLPHDALVLLTRAPAAAPVQVGASRDLRDRLSTVEWARVVDVADAAAEGSTVRVRLRDVVTGLSSAAWSATSGGCTVWLILGSRSRLDDIDPTQQRAAMQVAMLAAARARRVADDPPPGTLGFSHAMSLERERVRAQLSNHHAATLSGILHILRSANDGASRTATPEVAEAINLASRSLLDLETLTERHDPLGRVALSQAYGDAEREVRRVVRAARLRVFADLDAEAGAHMPQAIAQAAMFVSGAAALQAMRREGATKLRLLWRLTPGSLVMTVADDGVGSGDADGEIAKLPGIERRLAGLRAEIEIDSNPDWGTTLTCRLPLHEMVVVPETPASIRLDLLRDREREVLELMIAGLRNSDIADRLFISVRTVKHHVSNILQKLDVGSRTEAIALAHAAGISASPLN